MVIRPFAGVHLGPKEADDVPEFGAVMRQQFGGSGLEDVLADVEGEVFAVEEAEVFGQREYVLAHGNLDEGDAKADISQL